MIPIKDTIKSRSTPVLVLFILFLNSFVFILEVSTPDLNSLFTSFGFVPKRFFFYSYVYPSFFSPQRFLPLLTSLFLHGGILHLLGNMLFLWVFADNVEDVFGKIRFILLYFFSGFFASIFQGLFSIKSTTPLIGASGAIAGVLGAYFVLFPFSRILTLIPIFFYPIFVEIRAPIFLVYWFLMQFFYGVLSIKGAEWSPVAWWAHIGGFLFGVFFTLLFCPKRRFYY